MYRHLSFPLLCALIAACNIGGKTGSAPPPPVDSTCAVCTFAGNEGMCMSRDFDAAKQALADPTFGEALDAATDTGCTTGEVCILCKHPATNEDTGACDLAALACPDDPRFEPSSCDDPYGYDVEFFDACGKDSYCLSYEYIDDQALVSHTDVCPGDDSRACVPRVVIETSGNFILDSCTGLAGGEGRCLPNSMKTAAEGDYPQNDCAPGESCVNCFDPFSGGSTGICDMGCDPGPQQGARRYSNCSGSRGRCVENTALPDGLSQHLPACSATTSCTPVQVLEDRYAPCLGENNNQTYPGTCLDTNVMQLPNEGDMQDNGYCSNIFGNGFRCVPCSIPGVVGCAPPDNGDL